ncbi:hypothetical protein [Roseateles saccharophilus]|uniref:Cellulose biosynthesis protein BcsS n=1 Tax=Roseateles saccharophilus TaxID=304 RepID=A0A4R3VKF7_ROSSA|nr:hypothetical protein [Roseateles saccharophilus]MDG0831204.1 hypothetical protein [Roseateles saccharophilus]TCV04324.1 hypothetical protein EV671_100179 [Roseateles saccharophilus]
MRIWHWVLLAALAGPARADPGYYIVTLYDQAGRVGAELRYWTVKPPGEGATLWPELGLSYGVNTRWTTRLLASWEGESLGGATLDSWNWINEVLLTQGEKPYDLALHAQLVRNPGDRTHALELGPVWQTDLGRLKLNANAFWEYDSGRRDTRLKLQWRGVYRVAPGWRLGAEGFSEVGRWNDWLPHARQSHRAGPALLATLWDEGPDTVTLNTAYLFGKTYGRRGDMFTMQLQWLR